MCVRIVPGQIALIRILRLPYSRAADLVIPITPCFEDTYAEMPARPTNPPTDAVLTIAPAPCSSIWVICAFIPNQIASRLTR
ncbi:hypothetical protein Y600_5903 [Burkholderia pseudomallei MSHR3709]|nr:hypothetical protein Y600_5903 [Burkholderia pseudomallei MSHR3709]